MESAAKKVESENEQDRAPERRSNRAWRGCNEGVAELTVGSCNVLGDFFYDLGEAFARTRPPERGGRRRGFVTEAADSVCDTVTRGVTGSARTLQRSLDRFATSVEEPAPAGRKEAPQKESRQEQD